MDTAERQALAESFDIAAGKLESGADRLLVEESLRTAIAAQPTSGRWANEIDTIVQTAIASDPVVYAKNMRLIAKELREKESEYRSQKSE